MTNRCVKRCSVSLTVRDMQVQTAGSAQLAPGGNGCPQQEEIARVGEDVEKRDPCALLAGM